VKLGNDHIANSVGNITHVSTPLFLERVNTTSLSVGTRLLAMV
jgi:hypothetical protein